MIHQHIYASPKPGMTEHEFQDYWLNVHAVKYASKIKQIKKYLICTRVPCMGTIDPPVWSGCAEIWLENEKEQLASLQSKEFLEGARLDEPKWAAFWNTMVLDTDSQNTVLPEKYNYKDEFFKLTYILKRKHGLCLESFRNQFLQYQSLLFPEIEYN